MLKYLKNSIITCKLETNNLHIVKCPKRLPCGYTCCLQCIKRLAHDGNKFKCAFCKNFHRISKDLSRNVNIEYALDSSLEILIKEFSIESKNDALNLKGKFFIHI
jgi:hypothetical protein